MVRRLPVYLLLDTSGSMKGEPMESLRAGLQALISSLRRDPHALESVCLSVITFDREAKELCPLTSLEDFQCPHISGPESGPTHLGAALQMVCGAADRDVIKTTRDRKGDWRPMLFVITDGSPSDTQLFEESLPLLNNLGFASIIACAAGPKAKREPLEKFATHVVALDQMDGSTFASFFRWVSSTISCGNLSVNVTAESRPGFSHGFAQTLRDLIAQAPVERGFPLIDAGRLAALLGFPQAAELTTPQNRQLTGTLAEAGYHIAPNPLLTQQPLAWSQTVTLYPRDEDDGVTGDRLPGLLRFLYLAVAVVSADGSLDDAELRIFNQAVVESGASEGDLRHLRATEAAMSRDVSVAVLALPQIAGGIPSDAHLPILKTLLHLSAADGEISQDERKMLRLIANAFELDESWVDNWIQENTASGEITVAEAIPAPVRGEAIPPQSTPAAAGLQLDMARILELTRETREVVAILVEAMNGGETPGENDSRPVTPAKTPAAVPEWFDGLPLRYHTAMLFLVGHDLVSLERFEELARDSHLIPDDLLTSINHWSDDRLGDFLLEKGSGVRVFRNLLPAY